METGMEKGQGEIKGKKKDKGGVGWIETGREKGHSGR